MKKTIIGIVLPVALIWLGSFGCDGDKVTRQEPGYKVTGAVTVAGTMRDEQGIALGSLEIAGLDGIRVMLVRGSDLQSIVLSDSGAYTFTGAEAGSYTSKSTVNNIDFVTTPAFTVADADFGVTDTLRVTGQGTAVAYPNPTNGAVTLTINHTTQGILSANILGVDQSIVRQLVGEDRMPGTYSFVWDGQDGSGGTVADGPYWVLVNSAGTLHHVLIVRDTTP